MAAQGFIRALKSSSDPPEPGGPTKLEIARNAWESSAVQIPSKADLIVEWILAKMLKAKSENNPALDAEHWALLAEILVSSESGRHNRPLRTWVLPILHRIPLGPILKHVLDHIPQHAEALTPLVERSMHILWPMSVQKSTVETLLDVFGAVLRATVRCQADQRLARIGVLVSSSFRSVLGNTSSKKKVHATFLSVHLRIWLECISVTCSDTFDDIIYVSGTEILFNAETLRQSPDTLFAELQKLNPDSSHAVFLALPRLMGSYLVSLRKHRNVLFPGSDMNSIREIRSAGMKFFILCCGVLPEDQQLTPVWNARVGLLAIVEKENIFIRSDEIKEAEEALGKNVAHAAATLSSNNNEIVPLAIELLCIVTKISYDHVSATLPDILEKLFFIPASQVSFRFLGLLLDYHTKSRTLNEYIFQLLNSIIRLPVTGFASYQAMSASPLMHHVHHDQLAKSVRTFLTPGQVPEVVDRAFACIEKSRPSKDPGDERARKRLKVNDNGTAEMSEIRDQSEHEAQAVRHSLCSRVAGLLFASLPLGSLAKSAREGLERSIHEAYTDLRPKVKHLKTKNWHKQITVAADLRMRGYIRAAHSLHFPSEEDDECLCEDLLRLASDKETVPELTLEIFRTLLASCASGDVTEPQTVLNSLVAYIDQHLDLSISWTGHSCDLTVDSDGRSKAALALYKLALERWLSCIDRLASAEQLGILMKPLLNVSLPLQVESHTEIEAVTVVSRALRSALFWECVNIRTAVLSLLDAETAVLESVNLHDTTSQNAVPRIQLLALNRAMSAYRMLLYVPIEYLTRVSRMNLVRRAMILDIVLGDPKRSESLAWEVGTLRVFIKRAWDWVGGVDHPLIAGFLGHLLDKVPSQLTPEFSNATLSLIEGHFIKLLKSSPEEILPFIKKLPHSHFLQDSGKWDVRRGSFVKLVEALRRDSSLSSPPETVRLSLLDLHRRMMETLLPPLTDGSLINDTKGQIILLQMWRHVLIFGRWLRLDDGIPRFGQRHVSQILSFHSKGAQIEANHELSSSVFAVLLEESRVSDTDFSLQLQLIVASYIALSRFLGESGLGLLDGHMSNACQSFTPTEFAHVLELLAEDLSTTRRGSEDHLACLTHLSVVALRQTPQGTFKHVQDFASRCLNVFANRSVFSTGSLELRVQVLEFVSQHCSDRPAALRIQDLDSVWSLLAKFLRRSTEHDSKTTPAIFHSLVAVISGLVRLRRDLVVHTLPHLGFVLRQLLSVLRNIRPQLGGKQTKLVMDSLPMWINVAEPLGVEEAKSLGRLLSTLTVKTIPRSHGHGTTTTEPHKAESLAKPLSKHAAHTIHAYIEVMNDPLCLLPLDLRQELHPGLFSLCGMLGEHDRDAMMVSALDVGGKATMKALWKEYEKQKYIGKG